MFQLFEFYLEPLEKYKFDVKNPAIESKTKLDSSIINQIDTSIITPNLC